MLNTFILILEYAAMRTGNYLIYFLQKLPLIGKKVPNRWYKADSKDLIYWLGAILRQIKNILGKAGYIVALLGLPTLGYLALKNQTPTPQLLVDYGLYYFVILNLLFSGFINPILTGPRQPIDYELVKLARIDDKQFYLIKIINYLLQTSLVMTLMLLVANIFLPIGTRQVLSLGLLHIGSRLSYEAISLYLFEKYDFDLYDKEWRVGMATVFPVIPAYVFPFWIRDFSFTRWIVHPAVVVSLLVIGAIGLRYLLRSHAYIKLSNAKINLLDIRKRVAAAEDVRMAGGRIKDHDVSLFIPEKKLAGLTGYDYLHRIFFERYRATFQRAMRWRIAGYLVAFVAATIAGIIFPQEIKRLFPTFAISLIQFSFYYFYFIGSYGDRFTKILFLNMDYHLLPYSFFREPEAVTKSLTIRFKKLMELGLIPTLILSALYTTWALIFGGAEHWRDILLVNAVFIVLTIFFNLHHLIIYHTFQPYNKNMEVKSPISQGINVVIYIITFTLWRTKNLPTFVYLIVLTGMIIYVTGGIQLMKRLAPKNFKMKT